MKIMQYDKKIVEIKQRMVGINKPVDRQGIGGSENFSKMGMRYFVGGGSTFLGTGLAI